MRMPLSLGRTGRERNGGFPTAARESRRCPHVPVWAINFRAEHLLSGREVRRQPDKLNHLPAHSSKFDVSTYFPTTE